PSPPHDSCALSLHDALPIYRRRTSGGSTGASQRSPRPPRRRPRGCDSSLKGRRSPDLGLLSLPGLAVVAQDVQGARPIAPADDLDRKSTRLNSSHVSISYAV